MMIGHQNFTAASAKRSSATIRFASHCTLLSAFGAVSSPKPGARVSRYHVSPSWYPPADKSSIRLWLATSWCWFWTQTASSMS